MKKQWTYAQAVKEIEAILSKVQQNEVGIDELTADIQKATTLIRQCEEKLKSTELEITKVFDDPDSHLST